MRIPSKTKDLNVKAFNLLTRIKNVETFAKDISCDYKCKFNSTTCNSSQL